MHILRVSVLAGIAGLLVLSSPTVAVAKQQPDPLVARFQQQAPSPDVEVQVAHHATRYRAIIGWVDAVNRAKAEEARMAAAAAARAAAAQVVTPRRSSGTSSRSAAASSDTGGRHFICPQFASSANPSGDFAVPCYIIDRESDGNYAADNPHSSAQGAYQIMHLAPGTPPAEQDRIARGMALCNWNPPNYCAGSNN